MALFDKEQVQPFKMTARCDRPPCMGRELINYGYVLLSDPPKYVHTCPACFSRYELDQAYPTIVYEAV